jgi:DNA-binding NarL/FixJ family response regulator
VFVPFSLPPSILVADDGPSALEITRIVRAEGFHLAAVVNDPALYASQVARTRPALVIIDLAFGGDGIELLATTPAASRPWALYLSPHTDAETIERVLRADGAGFVAKPFAERQLAAAIRLSLGRAVEGRSATRTLAQIAELLRDFRVSAPFTRAADGAIELAHASELTAREREVVLAVTRHLRIARVARVLHISPHTVRNHLRSIYSKLDVHSVDELLDRVRRGMHTSHHDGRTGRGSRSS